MYYNMKLKRYKCIRSYSAGKNDYITKGNYYMLDDNSDYIDKYDNGIEGHEFAKCARNYYFKLAIAINTNIKVL
jgi:hypothetical protein